MLLLLVSAPLVSANTRRKPKPQVNAVIAAGGGGSSASSGSSDAADSSSSSSDAGPDLKSSPGNQLAGEESPDAPTPVFITVSVNKIGSIESVAGTFWFDFYIYLSWRDDRQEEGSFQTSASWWPQPELINKNNQDDVPEWSCSFSEGAPYFMQKEVRTPEEGMWSLCQIRQQVTLDTELQLHDFPFDVQNAEIVLESFSMLVDAMTFRPVKGIEQGLLPKEGPGAVSGWSIIGLSVATYPHTYDTLEETYHQLRLTLLVQRQADYYVTRYVWGTVFLVAMALLVLFVPGDVPDRLGFVQSSFLGIVSWQFILVSSAPVTGYNTRLDNFMLVSMVIVFMTYVYNSVRTSLRMDAVCHVSRRTRELHTGAHRVDELGGRTERQIQRRRGQGECRTKKGAGDDTAAANSIVMLREHELPLVVGHFCGAAPYRRFLDRVRDNPVSWRYSSAQGQQLRRKPA